MLKSRIQQDIISSLKEKDNQKAGILRYFFSQLKDEEIAQGKRELTDEEVVKVLNSQIKKINDSLLSFKQAKRQDLIQKAELELKILSGYLPQQMTDEELKKELEKIKAANPQIQHGALIGLSIKKLAGKADSSRIAQLIHEIS